MQSDDPKIKKSRSTRATPSSIVVFCYRPRSRKQTYWVAFSKTTHSLLSSETKPHSCFSPEKLINQESRRSNYSKHPFHVKPKTGEYIIHQEAPTHDESWPLVIWLKRSFWWVIMMPIITFLILWEAHPSIKCCKTKELNIQPFGINFYLAPTMRIVGSMFFCKSKTPFTIKKAVIPTHYPR